MWVNLRYDVKRKRPDTKEYMLHESNLRKVLKQAKLIYGLNIRTAATLVGRG